MTGLPFTITLDSQGFYRVSIPNYEGGEVVTVEDANAAIAAAVQAEREACAKRIEELADDGERAVAIMAELGYETHESYLAKALRLGSAAIRARNG